MVFKRLARDLVNPKSHLRRGLRKFGGYADQALVTASKALRLASPALAAGGVPASGLATANAALGGYERIREAVKNG